MQAGTVHIQVTPAGPGAPSAASRPIWASPEEWDDCRVTDASQAFAEAGPLLEDLEVSVPMDRATATDLVLEYLTNGYWPEDDPWWLYHLVEAVQEEIQEDRINTEWPRCPRHRNHPLWLEEPGGPELWWVCREDGDRVAELGALATCAREPGRM